MEAYILDWLNIILRWMHLITGIAWVGASFYFVWLDNSLENPPKWKKENGVAGDLWAFHGGGIYEVGKYALAPPKMPKTLHWFKWEAYSTWITGTLLLIVLYYFKADLYLVDSSKWIASPYIGIAASLLFILTGLCFYEILLRTLATTRHTLFVGLLVFVVIFYCWLSVQLFSDRAAYLHVGALLATIMVANVFIGIIPPQKKFIKALESGQTPNASTMLFAKRRSLHNNYLTLPVLFCMISNHYAFIYGHTFNWIALAVIIAITAYIRHFFNLKHKGVLNFQILVNAAISFLILISLMYWSSNIEPRSIDSTNLFLETTPIEDQLMSLISKHCTNCHATNPVQAGFNSPPAGLIFENYNQVMVEREKINTAIQTNYMPLGNITQMTEDERKFLLFLLERKIQ